MPPLEFRFFWFRLLCQAAKHCLPRQKNEPYDLSCDATTPRFLEKEKTELAHQLNERMRLNAIAFFS